MSDVVAGPGAGLGASELIGAAMVLVVGAQLDALALLLAVPAALLLAGLGLRDLLLRPTLSADAAGLTIVRGTGRVTAGWDEIERLRVVTDRRAPLLEIDLGETLVVLSRTRLGAPPYLVLEQLQALRHP